MKHHQRFSLLLFLLLLNGCQEAAPPASALRSGEASAPHTHAEPPATASGSAEKMHLSPAARAHLDLQSVEASIQTLEKVLRVPGVVKAQPDRVAYVTAPLSARIEQVFVNVGDSVRQGESLVALRSLEAEKLQIVFLQAVEGVQIAEQAYQRQQVLTATTVLTTLEQYQQELIRTHSAWQLTVAALERQRQLADKVIARKDVQAAQAEMQQARASYDAAQHKLLAYGITEAQLRNMLSPEGQGRPVLRNLAMSAPEAVQKYRTLGSPGELFALEASLRAKQAELQSVQQQLRLLGLNDSQLAALKQRGRPDALFTLTAPLSGIVAVRQATRGAVVESTEKLVELVDSSSVWVEGDVAEHLLAEVHPGQVARIRVAAYPQAVFTGTVRTLGHSVEPMKRTVHLWVEVSNPQGLLLPEMAAELTLVTAVAADVLAVPVAAVLTEGPEPFVFVEEGETYTPYPVVLGLRDDRYAEIRDGVFPGDRVVVRGAYELQRARAAASQPAQSGHDHSTHSH